MGLLNSGPSGFNNAPVSKAVLGLTIGVTIIGSMVGAHQGGASFFGYPHLPIPYSIGTYHSWQLLTAPFTLTSVGEIIFGSLLLYIFRLFERQWGSHKFSVFVIWSMVSTFLLQIGAAVLFNQRLNSGPYGLIFACLAQYISDVPATNHFRMWGFNCTEKVFVYLLGLQMMLSHIPGSFIAGICGLLSGLLYRSDALRIKNIRFPQFLVRFSTRFILPLLQGGVLGGGNAAAAAAQRRRLQQQQQQQAAAALMRAQQQHMEEEDGTAQGYADTLLGGSSPTNLAQQQAIMQQFFQFQQQQQQQQHQQRQASGQQQQRAATPIAAAAAVAPVIPNPEHVHTLEQMGFSRDAVVAALTRANNDLNRATNLLLDQQL